MPTVIVVVARAFGRCLDHKDGALMNAISALKTETLKSYLVT